MLFFLCFLKLFVKIENCKKNFLGRYVTRNYLQTKTTFFFKLYLKSVLSILNDSSCSKYRKCFNEYVVPIIMRNPKHF